MQERHQYSGVQSTVIIQKAERFECKMLPRASGLLDLVEAELDVVLTEALTAGVELVLADKSLLVTADNAGAGALALLNLLAGAPLLKVTHVCLS